MIDKGDLFAIANAAIIAISLILIFRLRQRPANRRQILAALLVFSGMLFLGTLLGSHMCLEGTPGRIILIYSLLGLVWTLFVGTRWTRRCGIVLLFLLFVVQIFTFLELIHGNVYTGNPDLGSVFERFQENILMELKMNLRRDFPDEVKYIESGWLASSTNDPIVLEMIGEAEESNMPDYRVHRLWHSWFTGLYGKSETESSLWIEGGAWPEAIDSICWREK